MRTIILSGGVFVATLVGATQALTPTRPTVAAQSAEVHESTAAPPVLTKVPARVLLDRRQPAAVVISGERFEPGLSVTLTSDSFGFTFGPNVLTALTSNSFELDLSAMDDGVYAVYVSNPPGRRSNAMSIVVAHAAVRETVAKADPASTRALTTSPSRESRTP